MRQGRITGKLLAESATGNSDLSSPIFQRKITLFPATNLMKEIILSPAMSRELTDIYATMELQYDAIAGKVGLSCSGCPDNCCDSYFLHYTYSEWAYLWEGIRALDDETLEKIVDRSKRYVEESRKIIQRKERPKLLCPLNDEGLCTLYSHRLMICRLHGIPHP